ISTTTASPSWWVTPAEAKSWCGWRWRTALRPPSASPATRPFAIGGSGPGPPGRQFDRDDRARWRLPRVVVVLLSQAFEGQPDLVPRLDHPGGSVDPHPPQRGPVLFVVINQECHVRDGAYVLETAQGQRGLRLGVDGREHNVPLEGEAARHHVRAAVR